jgi:hypothetical protein
MSTTALAGSVTAARGCSDYVSTPAAVTFTLGASFTSVKATLTLLCTALSFPGALRTAKATVRVPPTGAAPAVLFYCTAFSAAAYAVWFASPVRRSAQSGGASQAAVMPEAAAAVTAAGGSARRSSVVHPATIVTFAPAMRFPFGFSSVSAGATAIAAAAPSV